MGSGLQYSISLGQPLQSMFASSLHRILAGSSCVDYERQVRNHHNMWPSLSWEAKSEMYHQG